MGRGLPSKWSIACAITNSAVDIGRRAAGQINTSIYRLLIQTTQTWSLPLRYPKMITAAVISWSSSSSLISPLNQLLPLVSHAMKCCRRNGILLAQSPIRLSTSVEEQQGINTSIYRLLVQTTQTWSLPLRYPKMITAAVDLMVEQQ